MITDSEIMRIARLAKLSIEDDDIARLAGEFKSIVEFADQISDLNTGDCNTYTLSADIVLRGDEIIPPLPQELVLQNAHGKRDGFFIANTKGSSNENN